MIIPKIVNLFEKRNQGKRFKEVKLENGIIKEVPFFIYDKLQVGDSIIKNKNSDSVVYLRKNKIIVSEDINQFYREKIKTLK